ncbi:hypothetical protein EVAR_9174_1 [Eumeta japonica]|uniref:FLYWCH-type domain-containing protein n=1 Tax=Eumeta variegata TaxID=151549 RepID=A0A4C1WML6_EUMVA|nr:hypothetical protein EVAR_9174_1 [Eumeta japonica]
MRLTNGKTLLMVDGYTFSFSNQYKVSQLKVMRLANGKTLLMVNGYTFSYSNHYKGGQRWLCSGKDASRCRVFIYVNERMEVVKMASRDHSHKPPKYVRITNGDYVKV